MSVLSMCLSHLPEGIAIDEIQFLTTRNGKQVRTRTRYDYKSHSIVAQDYEIDEYSGLDIPIKIKDV